MHVVTLVGDDVRVVWSGSTGEIGIELIEANEFLRQLRIVLNRLEIDEAIVLGRIEFARKSRNRGGAIGIEDLTRARQGDVFEISLPAQMMVGQLVTRLRAVIV